MSQLQITVNSFFFGWKFLLILNKMNERLFICPVDSVPGIRRIQKSENGKNSSILTSGNGMCWTFALSEL